MDKIPTPRPLPLPSDLFSKLKIKQLFTPVKLNPDDFAVKKEEPIIEIPPFTPMSLSPKLPEVIKLPQTPERTNKFGSIQPIKFLKPTDQFRIPEIIPEERYSLTPLRSIKEDFMIEKELERSTVNARFSEGLVRSTIIEIKPPEVKSYGIDYSNPLYSVYGDLLPENPIVEIPYFESKITLKPFDGRKNLTNLNSVILPFKPEQAALQIVHGIDIERIIPIIEGNNKTSVKLYTTEEMKHFLKSLGKNTTGNKIELAQNLFTIIKKFVE